MINTKDLNKAAIIFGDEVVSYSAFLRNVSMYNLLLNKDKVHRVAIFSKNRPEWIYAFYSVWQAGATVVTIDFMSSVDDVSYILNDCVPDYIFYSKDVEETLLKAKEQSDTNINLICIDEIKSESSDSNYIWKIPEDKEKTAVIIYTSGTTGTPKGVMLSYSNLLINIDGVSVDVEIFKSTGQTLLFLPLHHIFPLLGSMVVTLFVGATVVMTQGIKSSDLMETLRKNNVNVFIAVPRLYELMYNGVYDKINSSVIAKLLYGFANFIKSKSLSKIIFKKVHDNFGGSVEYFVCGGAKLDEKVGGFFKTLGFEVLEGYGMTECAPMITFPRPGDVRIGSTGRALNNIEIKIEDGEILTKGPNVMQGYFNRPEETAEVIKDGWLHTGDLGRIDKGGYLYITGRKKEIIVLPNGKNINPVLLEQKLERNSTFVSEVAVFLNNGVLHGLIVPNYNKMSEENVGEPDVFFKKVVIPEFNNTLTPYQRLMKFTLIKQDIPRTRLGKIQRFKLEDILDKSLVSKEEKAEDPKTEEYKTIKEFIESQVKGKISPDDHLEFDIALDSLGKIELIDFIGKTFGVDIAQEELLLFPSVRKLAEHISDKKLRHTVETINWADIMKEKVVLDLPKASFLQVIIRGVSKCFFKTYFRFKGEGMNNIPNEPCIIAPNHQSFIDGLFLASYIKLKLMKRIYFYAKKKHVNSSFKRYLARKNNIIVMDLHNDLKESIQKLAEVIRSGSSIIIFPEGTRTTDGTLGDFKQTFAIISKELNVPIVPVAISGAYEALPAGKKIPKFSSKIKVSFLQPLYPIKYNSYEEVAEGVKASIKQALV